ncbi:LysR family transcriptional regulator [Phytomonospora endophytica]|uniref:DNA-binding transcriptional LysR family regulator n=1 Tax=Phytomonospora endophytica TaxID=714109 RepID=A0A841FE50_9ACTN|nr:LysR family transcriptional regulator [Phytomonospora endophytica]MBB6033293.1 DNA-binding transcriptional LysR family regulator [Phytomonospora endophytica]GIG65520.1 LysR family transcriptional regulator [Phytomonospora endophytica]
MLERQEVETFLVLAEELHFGRTAVRLRLTTGQVSKTVKKLERRVGAPLFERTSRVVRPTAIGRRLAEDLAPLVDAMEAAVRRAVDAGRGISGELRVAHVGSGTDELLLKAVALFTRRHPECEVHVREAPLLKTRASLLDGSVDVLFASFPFDGMANGPVLLREPRVLAVAAGHPLAAEESVTLEVLGDHPVVQYPEVTSEAFKADRTPRATPSGRPVPRGPVAESFSDILTLVALGKGVCPVAESTPRVYPRSGLAYVPISDAPPIERGPTWLAANTTERITAFVRAAVDATG